MNNATFIENEKLGILEFRVRKLLEPAILKRSRQRDFKRLSRLLRDLGLIDKRKVIYIGYTADGAGETGILVLFESPTKEVGVAEPESPAQTTDRILRKQEG